MPRKVIQKNIAKDTERDCYYVTFNYGVDASGKPIRKTKTYKRKQDAVTALKDFELKKIKDEIVLPTKTTLSEFLDYWVNDVKPMVCQETTLYGYRNIINKYISKIIGKYHLEEVNAKILNNYFATLTRDGSLSDKTIKKHYNLLKDAFKTAVIEDRVKFNPLDKVVPIKVEHKEQNVYNVEQLYTLMNVVKNTRLEIVVLFAGLMGLRREEICGLRWSSVDFLNNAIHISVVRTQAGSEVIEKKPKSTRSNRFLSMPNKVRECLLNLQAKQTTCKVELGDEYYDDDYVFCWDDGSPYRPNYLSYIFKETLDKHSLPHIRLHDLRHTFASIATDMGVSMYDISRALGHSEIRTTDKIYTHLFDVRHTKAISAIDDAIAQIPTIIKESTD